MLTMTFFVGADLRKAALFSVVISLLASFGFLLNDLWDRDVDRVNNARHFEDSSTATRTVGVIAAVSLLTTGLGLAYWVGPREFGTASAIAFGLLIYTVLLRKILLLPTILAAVLATSPLWLPVLLWANERSAWTELFIAAIILMVAAREMFMDARDRDGDIVGGRDTLATVFGRRIAKFVATMLTVSATVPFIVAVAHNVRGTPLWSWLGATVLAVTVLYLLVRPALKTLSDKADERASIQRYVLSSRVAMALIPILVLFWNR
jgi:4-hydroxybenzoate polyprenyltransferase